MKDIRPEDQLKLRLDLDPALRQLHVEPVSAPLYVVCAHFNPLRFRSRDRLYTAFAKHVADAGAILYTIELALRDRHHQVTTPHDPRAIQIRGQSEIWYKENLQNIAVQHLPADAEYIAFVDGDFHFTRADWATETVHMLQHYQAVQMYSGLTYESHDHRPIGQMDSFAFLHCNQQSVPKRYGHQGAVGGAWAFRRSALRLLGGQLDICILGSGDWHMAFAMAGREDWHPEMTELRGCPEYIKAIRRWQENAAALKGNIGYVDAHAVHHWHGPISKRGYATRPAILARHQFDPTADLVYDENGVLQLRGNKPGLRDDIRAYFRSRSEDSIDR